MSPTSPAAMERDEEGTFAQVQELRRKIIEPMIAEHSGRLVKTTARCALKPFASRKHPNDLHLLPCCHHGH